MRNTAGSGTSYNMDRRRAKKVDTESEKGSTCCELLSVSTASSKADGPDRTRSVVGDSTSDAIERSICLDSVNNAIVHKNKRSTEGNAQLNRNTKLT